MKVTMVKRGYATHTYQVLAESGETLTTEGIKAYFESTDKAPFGTYICHNNGQEAEVMAYVD